jgi:hypothetical protein
MGQLLLHPWRPGAAARCCQGSRAALLLYRKISRTTQNGKGRGEKMSHFAPFRTAFCTPSAPRTHDLDSCRYLVFKDLTAFRPKNGIGFVSQKTRFRREPNFNRPSSHKITTAHSRFDAIRRPSNSWFGIRLLLTWKLFRCPNLVRVSGCGKVAGNRPGQPTANVRVGAFWLRWEGASLGENGYPAPSILAWDAHRSWRNLVGVRGHNDGQPVCE